MLASIPFDTRTKLLFFRVVSEYAWVQSNCRRTNSFVNIKKAAHQRQTEASPGLGWVNPSRDDCSECRHSGHCQRVRFGRESSTTGHRQVPKNLDQARATSLFSGYFFRARGPLLDEQ